MKLRRVVLLKDIPVSELMTLKIEERFGPGVTGVFAAPTFAIDREGDTVLISGPSGSVIVPWTNVQYAVPELERPVEAPKPPEPRQTELKPVASSGKAGRR